MCVPVCQGENCLNLSVSFLFCRNAMVWAWNLFKHILRTHGCNTATQNYHSTVVLPTLTGWAAPLVSHSCAFWLITKWQQILEENKLVCSVSSVLQYANKPTMPDPTAGTEDRMKMYIYFSVLYHITPANFKDCFTMYESTGLHILTYSEFSSWLPSFMCQGILHGS